MPAIKPTCYFSPKGGCEAAIIEAIGKAHGAILVQQYELTSLNIAKALMAAAKKMEWVKPLCPSTSP